MLNGFDGGNNNTCIILASRVIVLPRASGPDCVFMKVQNVSGIKGTHVIVCCCMSSFMHWTLRKRPGACPGALERNPRNTALERRPRRVLCPRGRVGG